MKPGTAPTTKSAYFINPCKVLLSEMSAQIVLIPSNLSKFFFEMSIEVLTYYSLIIYLPKL